MSSSEILVDYSYLGPGRNIAGAVVMLILSIAAVTARFWGRRRAKLSLQPDDWLIFASLILFLGMTVCIFIGVARKALGYPTPKPPLGSPKNAVLTFTSENQQLVGKLEQAVLWQQLWQLGCVKAGVLMFYRRIFNDGKIRWFNILTIALLALVGIWTVAFFFTFLFACGTHFSAKWTTVVALTKYCHGSQDGQMAMAIADFVIDVFIILLPIPMVWGLHMPRSRKFVVSGVFLLGALAIAASGLRMAMFIIVDISFINPKQDGGWTVDLFLFWSIIESGLAILAACLPSLSFLGQKLGLWKTAALRSLRSVFSLQSLRSRASATQNVKTSADMERLDSADSNYHMAHFGPGGSVESYISGDASEHRSQKPPRGSISVTASVDQQAHMV